MKTIPLTQGKVALVDDEDFERISKHKWSAYKKVRKVREIWYAARGFTISKGKLKSVSMHQEVIGQHYKIDHRDGDGLNNQKSNLRPCTDSQNQQNAYKRGIGHSKYKGVSWFAGKWSAAIYPNRTRIFLGYFLNEEDAGRAYNAAAIKYYGEFARLNPV